MQEVTAEAEKKSKPPVDYLAIATKFLDAVVGRPCVFWSGRYWVYDGTCYAEYATPEQLQLAIARWMGTGFQGCANTRYSCMEVEFQIRAFVYLNWDQAMPSDIGSNQSVHHTISLQNGLLDLSPCRHGYDPAIEPHTDKWFSTSSLPFKYDPHATCPMWFKFLDECLEKDTQRIALLQEWFGYCCTHDTSYEKALFMEGPGANGKSVCIAVLERLVGSNNCSAVPLHRIGVKFQDFGMLGKLVNFSAETPAQCHVDVAALKQLISGDKYQFEQKGVDPFMATPTARLVISMNERPKFYDPSNAFWRRVMLMPWTYTVPEDKRELNLSRKIANAELPGIFLWAIEGLKRLWLEGKFTKSTAVQAAVESLRDEADPERAALLSLFETGSNAFVTSSEAYEAYQRFCNDAEPPRPACSPVALAGHIKRLFPNATPCKKRILHCQVRGWEGLRRRNHARPSSV